MLFTVYLPYLLCSLSLSYAFMQCLEVLDEATSLPGHEPSYTDCRNAVRHMPFSNEAADDDPATNNSISPPRRVTPAHPYYPMGDVISGSCRLILRCYESRVPMTLSDMEGSARSGRPKEPLTVESVRKLWTAQLHAAQQVLQDCIWQGMGGVQWEPIDLPESPFVWYAALVTSVKSWSDAEEAEQRALLAGFGGHWLHERSWVYGGGVYHV